MPTISPSRTSSERLVEPDAALLGPHGDAIERQQHVAGLARLAPALGDLAPDHQGGEGAPVGLRDRQVCDLPPGRSTATRSAIASTSPSLCEMKTIARPPPAESAQHREEAVDLLRRQHGGRLVEDEDAGVAVEHLQDLDPLLLADGEPRDAGVERDGEAALGHEPFESFGAPPAASAAAASSRSVPSTMFSMTVRLSASAKCWCTMPMPALSAACGEPGGSGCKAPVGAGDRDRPLVGDVVAEEDVHQRRLAGAVLAEKRQDLAALKVEVDAVVGDERTEALGDVSASERRAGPFRQRVGRSAARLRLGVVDVDAEEAVRDLLLLVLHGRDHVGRHELVVDREARAAVRHVAVLAVVGGLEAALRAPP